ncbi:MULTISPECIES: methyl-accepting chemotaxis protein [Bacillus cereus group]|uniref:methyl-accepting chemotaxis protein n=1 Tax=Bacillus cereus group TaxID=86661 RepID=UPI00065BF8C3|nr:MULTISPECIES: methyl-accepting chemotaxis protein [Bacillus cereus group]KMP99221.1 chemotaxis protein [Bacillus cereus]MED2789173.1 methyl-accepting chemotaxis protein [Bacillus thuringiensis]MED2811712.1 methyl-accepting chemotaxis protein [Bacillus thuringiensis]MED2829811.1 methyl-accepting chemotaxis protein [Bacillus thuringiensis]MED2833916.1 methyl-accepting chemotaxis protein [Bacillus thuringiensis]
MKKYWHKLSLLQKNILLTVLVILTLVGSMGALSFNMFQNSMMSIFERQSFETGDTVINQLDVEIVRDVAKDPTAQRVKKEKLTEQLDKAIKGMKSVGQTYVTGAKLNDKAELQLVALDTELANTVSIKLGSLKTGDYYEHPTHWMKTYSKVMKTKQAQMTEVYEDKLGFWVTILEPITDENKNIIAIVAADLDASVIPLTKEKFLAQGLLFIIISLTIATTIQIFISRNSLSPLKDLQEGLRKVGEGDLSIKLNERSDDIGITNSHFNNTIEKFNRIIDKVRQTAEQVSASSQELSANTKENSMAFQEIASSMTGLKLEAHSNVVHNCLGIVQEMESKMKQIKGAAKQVATASEGMEQHSIEGKDLIKQIVNQMKIIQDRVQDVSSSIYALEARSNEIITVITTVSNQTNLLALNATTEDSCAGKIDKEFSSVVEEVCILAEKIDVSSRDIAKLIDETKAEIEEAVKSMQRSSKEVESGIILVQSSGAFFEKISKSAQSVTNQIKATSSNSRDVLENSQSIVQVVNELSHIANTYECSSSNVEISMKEQEMYVQDIAELANSLNWLSQELQELIGGFKIK